MKVTFTNKFHGTSVTLSIKPNYTDTGLPFKSDLMEDLMGQAFLGDNYARRKLREIKNALCGISDCRCSTHVLTEKKEV